ELPPATSLEPPADGRGGPGELPRMFEAVGGEDLEHVPVEYSPQLASPLAESLGLFGMAGAQEQLRQGFHRRECPRVELDQFFQSASFPHRVARAASEPGAEGEHLGRRNLIGREMPEGATNLGLDLGGPGPIEASPPDHRIKRPTIEAAIEPT